MSSCQDELFRCPEHCICSKHGIYFNSHMPDWSWLSNFSPHPVGTFPTAEHAYQAAKSTDPAEWDAMRRCVSPAQAKKLSYSLKHRRENWDAVKELIMRRVLRLKFQDAELRDLLVHTHPFPLIHSAPWGDTYWGVDIRGQGQNRQGILLVELREELIRERQQ